MLLNIKPQALGRVSSALKPPPRTAAGPASIVGAGAGGLAVAGETLALPDAAQVLVVIVVVIFSSRRVGVVRCGEELRMRELREKLIRCQFFLFFWGGVFLP